MPYPTTGRPKGRPRKVAKPIVMHAYADASTPAIPDFFEIYPANRSAEAWAYLWAKCPHLNEAKGDGLLVGLVALKVAEVTSLRHRLARDGTSYLAANGQWASKPEVRQLETAEAQLTSWLSALGLSPADRTRLNLTGPTAGDTLAEYRARNARRTLDEVKAVVHNLA